MRGKERNLLAKKAAGPGHLVETTPQRCLRALDIAGCSRDANQSAAWWAWAWAATGGQWAVRE